MRVLLVQHSIDPPGGGNAVAAWMLQALTNVHQPATLTMRTWHPEAVDRYFGTSLAAADIPQIYPSLFWRALHAMPGRFTRLRMAMLLRAARRHAGDFDVLVTADNYAAFSRPGLQYLHYPTPLRPEPTRLAPLVHLYYRACDLLSGLSWDTARLNQTLANSEWTAAALLNDHGIHARVLYPPVVDPGGRRPWAERTNTFLCVGRFHGSKRFEIVVSILERVRASLPDARLRIVGSNVDADYTRRVVAMARRHPDWISIDEDLPQRQLLDLMGSCRYGIHAMEYEHFGMAVAEMARAGCVVFVHDSGGQVEAVGRAPELLWTTPDEAVSRIRDVVQDASLQEKLSAQLQNHAARFSSARFVREFRSIVEDYGTAMALNAGSRNSSS